MKNRFIKNSAAVLASFVVAGAIISANATIEVSSEQAENVKVLVTDYADLWTSTDITVEEGTTVQWYVSVPEDTEPKGCRATVKIPGLGFGTDTYNKEEGHWDAVAGINVTLGLPIIRASVDHGTGFGHAGDGHANELSLINAMDYAIRVAKPKER